MKPLHKSILALSLLLNTACPSPEIKRDYALYPEHKKEIAGRMDDLAMKEGQNGFSVFLGILGLTSLLGGLFNYRKQD